MKHKVTLRLNATGIVALLTVALCASAAESVPPKTVVLTFDDAVKSHRTFVAPLLKELNFGATFFVSQRWMEDKTNYMTWEEIGEIYEMGFEIGNHTWTHDDFSEPRHAARLAGEVSLVDRELAQTKARVPRPVSFAYTGNFFGPEAVRRIADLGYKFARRGEMPEAHYGTLEIGLAYDPKHHHPLLIPTTGDAYPNWSLDHFKKVVALATTGRVVVLQFHGVPDGRHPFVNTPPERLHEYMAFLKENNFHCVAIRDLERYIDRANLPEDPTLQVREPPRRNENLLLPVEMEATRADPCFWLENMLVHHHFNWSETATVLGWSVDEVKTRAAEYRITPDVAPAGRPDEHVRVLPYPGGRHPRIGFLDGAIDPRRGTKVSLFPPWKDGGYAVLDLPEAIFSNLGLTYLAHTHIPTIWDNQSAIIDNVDWIREPNGGLHSQWRLPNGIVFGAQVTPRTEGVDLELWLKNGTKAKLTELRTQICAMLKAARGFSEQDQQRKEYDKPLAVVKALDADRYLLLAFEQCGRAWGNEKCPCVHSDPVLPDAAPGERVSVRGRLWFYEGADIQSAKKRMLDEIRALGKR